ncbi:hypothetical protein Anapl_02107 [Anas platyrhynchos]|uniref:Uncharacterized protein n=1 Tax=Anas platyrhynchos TaxID=8839 RepID=R0LXI6_ANAPL|nr:hypothetical protein Anapl_02107 [Anas platyrhynchos]
MSVRRWHSQGPDGDRLTTLTHRASTAACTPTACSRSQHSTHIMKGILASPGKRSWQCFCPCSRVPGWLLAQDSSHIPQILSDPTADNAEHSAAFRDNQEKAPIAQPHQAGAYRAHCPDGQGQDPGALQEVESQRVPAPG